MLLSNIRRSIKKMDSKEIITGAKLLLDKYLRTDSKKIS